jgi:hypothetical protein
MLNAEELVPRFDTGFWLKWIAANAVGEFIGLGTVFLIGFGLAENLGEQPPVGTILLAFCAILLGGFEGFVIGLAQWLVLRERFASLSGFSWIKASIIGALTAWLLGMIPSTIASLSAAESQNQTAPDIPNWLIFPLAGAMGLVLGNILALPQWFVLRRHADKAGWWFVANALAWTAGMPIIFIATTFIDEKTSYLKSAAIILPLVFLAGAVVGAIGGIILVKFIKPICKN